MKCFILRGVSGSGKDTYAAQIRDAVIVSADLYLYGPSGHYQWDRGRARDAHRACLREFHVLIGARHPNIVINQMNIANCDVAPYYALADAYGYRVEVLALLGCPRVAHARGLHGVPLSTTVDQDARLRLALQTAPAWWTTRTESYG